MATFTFTNNGDRVIRKPMGITLELFLRNKHFRLLILLLLLGSGLLFIFKEDHHLDINDFIQYWSASRITMGGGNPYSSEELLSVQIEGGLNSNQPILMYNPPWTLPLVMVFGIFPRPEGQALWVIAQVGALLYCSSQLWQLFKGNKRLYWLSWLVTFTFGPVIASLLYQGQIAPFVLTGLVGFMAFIDRPQKVWVAGSFAVLASIKPQVPYLFLVVFILWTIFNQKWSVLLGFVLFFVALNIIVLIFSPDIYNQYFQLLQSNAPTAWATPTIGTYLRLFINPEVFLLAFIPPVCGIIWLVSYWVKKNTTWNWKQQMPIVLFVGTITSAYIWTYDMVILLIPVLLAFIWLHGENKRWITAILVIAYLIIDVLYLWLHLRMDDLKFIWFAPVLFIWYLITQGIHKKNKYPQTIANPA